MRIFTSLAVFALTLATASAGRLDIAVVQFPEVKTVEQLNSALANTQLFEITNSDRTRTTEPDLKGGTVIFAQSIGTSGTGAFGSTTRLDNKSAVVTGSMNGGSISIQIETTEGIKAGLRSFENKVYTGSGSLTGHVPKALSMRVFKGKVPNIVKNRVEMTSYERSVVVIAQYTP